MDEKQEVFTSNTEMTAGEMLHNARTTGRRKREIPTIAKLLCIREEFLEALESGNYRVIPEDVYILGFARSYAVELGLNPDEVIEKLKRELGIAAEEKEVVEPEVKKETPKIKFNKEIFVKYFKSAWIFVKKHWIWFASGLALVVVAVVLLIVLLGGDKPAQEDVEATANETLVVATTTVVAPDFRFPVREKFNEKSAKE